MPDTTGKPGLRERLIAAKLAGTASPSVEPMQYRFRSNEQAADVATKQVAAWLRAEANKVELGGLVAETLFFLADTLDPKETPNV